jgi:hypothetical protein
MAKLKTEDPLAYAAIQDMRAIGDECLLATLPERAKEIKDKTDPVTIFLRGSDEMRAYAEELRTTCPDPDWITELPEKNAVRVQVRYASAITTNFTINYSEFEEAGKRWVRVTVVGQMQHALAVFLELHRPWPRTGNVDGGVRLYSTVELHELAAAGEWPLSIGGETPVSTS